MTRTEYCRANKCKHLVSHWGMNYEQFSCSICPNSHLRPRSIRTMQSCPSGFWYAGKKNKNGIIQIQ